MKNLAIPVPFHWENKSLTIPPNPSRLHLLFHEPKLGHLAALMAAGESGNETSWLPKGERWAMAGGS